MTDYFVDNYTNLIKNMYDIPEYFIRASAYHIISSTIGRFFRYRLLPGKGRPNLFFIISGLPGRTRRSTLQDFDSILIESTLIKYYEKTIAGFIDKNNQEKIEFIKSLRMMEGTPEGIIDHINQVREKTKGTDCFDIYGPEFGAILKKMKDGYEVGTSALLSMFYSGEGASMLLSQRRGNNNRYIPPNLYVTMFCGMQEPWEYISPIMIRQGLMRRIIVIFVPKNENYKPLLDDQRKNLNEQLLSLSEDLAKKMLYYHDIWIEQKNQGFGYINCEFNPTVMDNINNFDKEMNLALDNLPTNLNIVKQTLGEHLTKLTMLESIAQGRTLQDFNGFRYLNVLEEDYKNANEYLTIATANYQEWIPRLGTRQDDIRTQEQPLELVYRIIAESGIEGITKSSLIHKTHMSINMLDPLTDTLIVSGDITSSAGESSGGRRPTIYRASRINR
jgi:hypothetical protein